MNKEKRLISVGKDYTEMLPMFRNLVLRSGAKKGDCLIWAGCPGTCYAMATFFSYGLRDLGLNLYFAVDADFHRLWRLQLIKEVGVIASKKEDLENPIKAKVLVLMSGLLRVPFENVLKLVREGLASDGTIIGETVVPGLFQKENWGETVVPGLFQKEKWDEQIPFRFIFEFSMEKPTSFEMGTLS